MFKVRNKTLKINKTYKKMITLKVNSINSSDVCILNYEHI